MALKKSKGILGSFVRCLLPSCGQLFRKDKPPQKFCSEGCRLAAYNARRRRGGSLFVGVEREVVAEHEEGQFWEEDIAQEKELAKLEGKEFSLKEFKQRNAPYQEFCRYVEWRSSDNED